MANSTSTNLAALISPIVQEALFTANERSVMRGLVKNFTVPMNSGKVAQVPVYPTKDAVAIAEGTTLAGSAGDVSVATTTKSITLGEVGIMTNLTDMIRDTSEQDVISHLGNVFGNALAAKLDKDLIGLFSSFSTEMGPGAAADLTLTNLFKAQATLRAANAPGEYFAVLNPKQVYAVKSALTNTFDGANNVPDIGNEAFRNAYVGKIAGINIVESNHVEPDANDDAVGAVFSTEALGLAMQMEMNLEIERDAALRADKVVMTSRYGVAELFDAYGVKITSDSAL